MGVLESIAIFFDAVGVGPIANPLLGMALILGIIIALRILVRRARVFVKLTFTIVGIIAILWILSGMVV